MRIKLRQFFQGTRRIEACKDQLRELLHGWQRNVFSQRALHEVAGYRVELVVICVVQ